MHNTAMNARMCVDRRKFILLIFDIDVGDVHFNFFENGNNLKPCFY